MGGRRLGSADLRVPTGLGDRARGRGRGLGSGGGALGGRTLSGRPLRERAFGGGLLGGVTRRFRALARHALGFLARSDLCALRFPLGFAFRLDGARCLGFGVGLLLRGFDVSAATTTHRRRIRVVDHLDGRWRWCFIGLPATTTRLRLGHGVGRFRSRALFTLPAKPGARDLVVGEQRHMAAHRNVHLPKQGDHIVGCEAELPRQVMHTKLTQAFLLCASGARSRGRSVSVEETSPIASRIPRASALSTIPMAAVASRPTIAPSSAALGHSTISTRFARSSGTTLSSVCRETSIATIASTTLPRRACSRTCSAPVMARRPRTPRPISPTTLRRRATAAASAAVASSVTRPSRFDPRRRRSRLPSSALRASP
jgi:hypothetical protein